MSLTSGQTTPQKHRKRSGARIKHWAALGDRLRGWGWAWGRRELGACLMQWKTNSESLKGKTNMATFRTTLSW